jgi:hypothetical protein
MFYPEFQLVDYGHADITRIGEPHGLWGDSAGFSAPVIFILGRRRPTCRRRRPTRSHHYVGRNGGDVRVDISPRACSCARRRDDCPAVISSTRRRSCFTGYARMNGGTVGATSWPAASVPVLPDLSARLSHPTDDPTLFRRAVDGGRHDSSRRWRGVHHGGRWRIERMRRVPRLGFGRRPRPGDGHEHAGRPAGVARLMEVGAVQVPIDHGRRPTRSPASCARPRRGQS